MRAVLRRFWKSRLGLAMALLSLPTLVLAAERLAESPKLDPADAGQETVELFAAIDSGQIGVRLIPEDSSKSHVLIENKTNKPLSVKLPETFAGVPVLAQNLRGGRNNNNNNASQGFGGGMGGMGMGGMGMGMFNIAPEKVGKFEVTTVCLEHGKREPRAAVPYEIRPLESFTDRPEVHELCRLLGTGQIDQRAAQAAAWHLNNGMSWDQLAAKRLNFANGSSTSYFTAQQLQYAMQLSARAAKLAEQRSKGPSENQSASLH